MPETKEQAVLERGERRFEARELSPEGIADNNCRLIERQQAYRRGADIAASALIPFKEVQAIAVFGAVAAPLWKEVPRFDPYHSSGIALWHECARIDLAVWLERFHQLSSMRRAIDRALGRERWQGHEVALNDVSITILDADSGRYVGDLCQFIKCPAGDPACEVPGCGAVGHLRQFRDYLFDQDQLSPERCFQLFDRSTGSVRRAVDLPRPSESET